MLSVSSNVDYGSDSGQDVAVPRFPHTRAQLSAIARTYKPADNYDSDAEGDEFSRVSSEVAGKVVGLLDEENEDDLKVLLKATYGIDEEDQLEQHVLDLMHKHRDDIAGVPFLFLTPTRRPISRPSSRASTHSARLVPRPDTPQSAPSSPLAMVFRRPHTPATSPLAVGQAQSYMTAKSESRSSSPAVIYTPMSHAFAASMPSSPISSPRILNAKASEFKPIPRPLSAASSHPSLQNLRDQTPSPDLWSHTPNRPSSKLAIAAPLLPDSTLLARSITPSSSLRSSLRPGEDDDEDDPFDPFSAKTLPRAFHPVIASELDSQAPWAQSPNSASSLSTDDQPLHMGLEDMDRNGGEDNESDEAAALLTDGMTPFDVLSSVFGATLAPSELEEALVNNGYDFEHAMTWLVDRALPSQPQDSQPRVQNMGGRVMLVSRDEGHNEVVRGGRAGYGNASGPGRGQPRFNGRPVTGGTRVCRYFLAGECLRADCRFSHDLERALCRFWLRGTCAKGENCEFMHHLPENVDVSGITQAMLRTGLQESPTLDYSSTPPLDDFPALGMDNFKNRRGTYQPYNDPGRARFASAVKRATPNQASAAQPQNNASLAARRAAMGNAAEPIHHSTAIVAPKTSPRIKLRPPSLMPTLPTGESVSSLYMAYRSRALQLGAARNACLSRAADAWRRGDGAAAKRFSREGHELNAKMRGEMTDAASKLVKERAKLAQEAVKARDASWSDEPGDRVARGRLIGGGLGVCLGIASKSYAEGNKLTAEERTESMLDLHGLHSNEATEVLEEFLLALEREHFYGLAYAVVGEEKHTGTQDPARGASRARLAAGVREWLHRWGYPWSERDGVICVDSLTHATG
ncbi:hypothetical protein NEOLEDRAFT_1088013 [Neolentinus lepideus HHB14362 ss-1]|uniref:DUF1771-domain-containing protein n=1 Tax=Neolentinus lepideus HHB14362 ss-1 TaxID=1314782 RepID=A0A165U8I8_9AGAM|nr:hypothetical protein NEOLEDRAFT_1088013 [Neolentinus lepideus HHB14362 ss-1]